MEKLSDSPYSKKPKLGTNDTEEAMHVPTPTLPGSERTATYATVVRRELQMPPDAPPTWFTKFFADFENRMDARIEQLLDKKLGAISTKVTDHDEAIKSMNFDIAQVQDTIKNLKLENEKLETNVDDLENRSRRNNLVLFGIGEVAKEDCYKTVSEFLHFVGREEDMKNIERCHRTPTFLPPSKYDAAHQAPRPRRIHIAFNSFAVKEKVRKAAIEKLKATKSLYRQHATYVAEDLSSRIIQLRKKKSPMFRRLKGEVRS